ncbi:hypothetical protein AUN14_16685 [Cronobacter muytjensii]|uniref:Uncharacterized protein n=1 Tax=Cronobacter muytjensii TaxID=413501 RepID=A0A2T7APH7_9ENTR|nr:hypothetical protein AUN14_16685 [Cronobacter muytjensii]
MIINLYLKISFSGARKQNKVSVIGSSILTIALIKNETLFYLELKTCFAKFKMIALLKTKRCFAVWQAIIGPSFLTRGHREMA